jgi:hypothetical protein
VDAAGDHLLAGARLAGDEDGGVGVRYARGQRQRALPARVADSGTVILVTVVWTIVSLLFFSLLLPGRARLILPGLTGIFAVTEIHHVFEALSKGGYDPGVITSVPYAIAGAYLVAAVWRELRTDRGPVTRAAAVAAAN